MDLKKAKQEREALLRLPQPQLLELLRAHANKVDLAYDEDVLMDCFYESKGQKTVAAISAAGSKRYGERLSLLTRYFRPGFLDEQPLGRLWQNLNELWGLRGSVCTCLEQVAGGEGSFSISATQLQLLVFGGTPAPTGFFTAQEKQLLQLLGQLADASLAQRVTLCAENRSLLLEFLDKESVAAFLHCGLPVTADDNADIIDREHTLRLTAAAARMLLQLSSKHPLRAENERLYSRLCALLQMDG